MNNRYAIFILCNDGLVKSGLRAPLGSPVGNKYSAVGYPLEGGGGLTLLKRAQLKCRRGGPGPLANALGIHILRRTTWDAQSWQRSYRKPQPDALLAMAYRTESMPRVLRDYPEVLTKSSTKWLGLDDYDESIQWMPDGKWSVYQRGDS